MSPPRSATWCSSINLQHSLLSLSLSSSCLRLLPRLPFASMLPSITVSTTCLQGTSYARCDQYNFPSSSYCTYDTSFSYDPMKYFIFHTINPTDLHLSSAPPLQSSQVLLIYFTKCSKSKHHTKLRYSFVTLTVSSINLSPVFWWKCASLVECCSCHGNPGFNFTCTRCSVCYSTAQILEIFQILRLFSI